MLHIIPTPQIYVSRTNRRSTYIFGLPINTLGITTLYLISILLIQDFSQCTNIPCSGLNLLPKNGDLYYIFQAIINRSLNLRKLQPSIENIKGFIVYPYNRFGNHVYQFTRILQYCKLLNFKKVIVPHNYLFFKNDFYVDDIHVQIGKIKIRTRKYIKGFFYWPVPGVPLNFSIINLYKNEFLKSFSNISLGENDLYLHLRSGDIFVTSDHSNYAQPPLQYFVDVINYKNWTNVYLLTQNFINPVILGLLEKNVTFIDTNFNFTKSIHLIVNSFNLAIGRTTFGLALSFLSRNLNLLFTFNCPTNKLPSHFNCDPDDSYVDNVLNQWRHSSDQIVLLFTSKCRHWNFFEQSNQPKDEYKLFHYDEVYKYWFN